MDAERMMMQRRIDNLQKHIDHLHGVITDYERQTAKLTVELETVKRERDAALKLLKYHKSCAACKHSKIIPDGDRFWIDCPKRDGRCRGKDMWEWRGPCKENGGIEND